MPPRTLLEQLLAAQYERYSCWNTSMCALPKTRNDMHCIGCDWQGMGTQELANAKQHGRRRTDRALLERAATLIRITKEM